MDIPNRDVRLAYLGLVMDLLRNGQRAYYPDLRFIEGVEVTMISHAIFIAQAQGAPFTISRLSKHLDIPRATLLRRLAYLKRKGFVRRDAEHLSVDPAILSDPAAVRNLRRACQIIIDTAHTLSKMDMDPPVR
jgi:hypothetical protein